MSTNRYQVSKRYDGVLVLMKFYDSLPLCPNVTGKTKERIAKASGLVLVRSPSLTSHKWRERVPSGRLVCRYHDVFI